MHASRHRWFVVAVFFFFMLLHQSDRLLISTLTPDIMATFQISMTQMGAVSTGALIVAALFYPVWGYLYDRFGRAKLLALASLIWGGTTWLNAIAPNFRAFLLTRASTGIDDSSYPGIYSLVADYFPPRMRGKVNGLLELAMPLGFLAGMLLALVLKGSFDDLARQIGGIAVDIVLALLEWRESVGWRGAFYITGTLGIVLSALIFLLVREPKRGGSEPELAGVEQVTAYRFNWPTARALFGKRTLRLMFLQGFFGVFPWNVITFWFFTYLEKERGYSGSALFITMAAAVLVLAAGYPLGGALGDALFKRTVRGRMYVATVGVIVGMVLLALTLQVPVHNQPLFLLMLALTALFIPFSAPNVIATVYDITVPEVRSTALAIQYLIESAGAALAPLIAGWIADRSSLGTAIFWVCVSTWALCAVFYSLATRVVPPDIAVLREQMRVRAEREKALQTPAASSV